MVNGLRYTKYDLGILKCGQVVVVSLKGNAANVRLMDESNYIAYKSGRRHHYIGGLATKSPVKLTVPHNGHWYVTVDLSGLRGRVGTSVRVEPECLPPITQELPLASIQTLVRDAASVVPDENGITYDVFISHASEDKDAVARPLATALRAAGLTVWYDEYEMKLGDSLRRKIDQGLAHSRFGIVIISRDFINKGWTNYELDGIITKSISGEQTVLPIWHNITKDEVIAYSPTLADKLARNTAIDSIEDIATEVAELISSH